MRKILLVIDMQNDFINGALGTPEAEAIVDRVAEEIGKYPAGDVIATRDTHPENYLETQEGRNLPVVHCVQGTTGWELHPKIAAALKDAVVIDKPTLSWMAENRIFCFFASLANWRYCSGDIGN